MARRTDRRFDFTNALDLREYEYTMLDETLIDEICKIFTSNVNIHPTLFYSQMDGFDCMDLATPESAGRYWDRRILDQGIQQLPPESREYFLEVERIDRGSFVDKIYSESIRRLATIFYGSELRDFIDNVFKFYERWSFTKLQELKALSQTTQEERLFKKEQIVTHVERYLEQSRRHAAFRDHAFVYILPVITDSIIDSSALTIQVLETLFYLSYTRTTLFPRVPNLNALRVLLRHAKEQAFDFWGLMRGTGELAEESNPLVDYLDNYHQHIYARTLLDYGFRYIPTERMYEAQRMDHRYFRLPRPENRPPMTKNAVLRSMLALETFNAFYYDGFQRNRIRTWERLLRSIPEPSLTEAEVTYAVCVIVKEPFRDRAAAVLTHYPGRNFDNERLIGEIFVFQPRSLQHLCRCRIRHILADNFRLPEGIDQLNLTVQNLIPYLRLEYW